MISALKRLFYLSIGLSMWQCATQTTPQGGPKDLKPPVLLRSSPQQNERNFKGKAIELTFDEQIKLSNASEQIIITPSPGKKIDYKTKQNKVIIEPADGWKDSTTYSVVFREGIQDVTESNFSDSLHLAFSTGSELDSLFIAGRITNAITEDIPTNITVGVYQSDTTDIFTDPAVYFAKTDKQGIFKIENLKPGKYFVYAFEDRNKNLKVESTTEKFGFKKDSVILSGKIIDSVLIALVKADSRPIKINSIRHTDKTTKVIFNKSITSVKIDTDDIVFFGDNTSELVFYNPISDSTKINLQPIDSIGLKFDTTIYIKKSPIKSPPEPLRIAYSSFTYISEPQTFTVKGTFSKPIEHINLDSIFIKLDSTNAISFATKEVVIDNKLKTITLLKTIDRKTMLQKKGALLFIGKGFLVTFDNDSTKSEKKTIKILTPETTANLEVEIRTKSKNYIIQLLKNNGEILETAKNITPYVFKNLEPIAYKIRVIEDINNNGEWDPGNIYERREPEPVHYYRSAEGKVDITTRENSDIGPLILSF